MVRDEDRVLFLDGGEPEDAGVVVGGVFVLYLLARVLGAVPQGLTSCTDLFMGILIIAVLPFVPWFSWFIGGVLIVFGNIIAIFLTGVERIVDWSSGRRERKRWSY